MKNKKKVLIDTDPGVDDAIALLIAFLSNKLEILGISTTYGNNTVDKTTNNALKLINFLKNLGHSIQEINIPIIKGSAKPLKKNYKPYFEIHGKDGLGNSKLPNITDNNLIINYKLEDFYFKQINNNPHEVSIICLGPLTNIAKVIKRYPHITSLIQEIVIIGGSLFYPGNFNHLVEANFGWDPEAAKIVLSSKIKNISLIPLNTTEKFCLNINMLKKINDIKLRKFLYLITTTYFKYYIQEKKYFFNTINFKKNNYEGCIIHDVVAIIFSLLEKNKNYIVKQSIKINLVSDGSFSGLTIPIIKSDKSSLNDKNIKVLLNINKKAFWDTFYNILNNI